MPGHGAATVIRQRKDEMNWKNVKLIFLREFRDQLRDRRTLFVTRELRRCRRLA